MSNLPPHADVQAFAESVLASVAAGVVVLDDKLRYVAWNRVMQDLTGVAAEQVRGCTLSELFPELEEYGLGALHRRALAGESVASADIRFVADGTERETWIVAQYRPHVAPDGKIVGVVGTVHDITDRKRAEDLLRSREQRFRAIIEDASEMIAILDAQGRTLYESPSNERIVGYKPEELVGRNALELIHPGDRDRVGEALARTVEQPETPVTVEFRYLHRDGSWRILEAVGKNLIQDPAVAGIVVNSRDLTERKLLEERLRKAQTLALELQLQPHFLFNALNTIVGQVHDHPDMAESMIVRLSDFLRLVLGSAGQREVPLAREIELLGQYLSIQQVRFGDRLRVETEIAPEAHHALIPPLILQPVVENALKHGLEARAGEGRIEIRGRKQNSSLVLSVADSGVGLRGQAVRTPRQGIGLANVRSRLDQHYPGNSAISLEENPEGGAVVTITVPFHSAAG